MAMDPAGIRAYQQQMLDQMGEVAGTPKIDETAGAQFTEMVQGALEATNTSLAQAEQLTASAATGQAELVDVVTAVAAAEVQLETVMAVRDQVIRAYNEILRMPI